MASDAEFRSTFFVFNEFPLDVGLAILSLCSPHDLAQLALTTRFMRDLILNNPSLFNRSWSNVARGKCPPVPACPTLEATRYYSQTAYALFIFGVRPCSSFTFPRRLFIDWARLHRVQRWWGDWLPRARHEHRPGHVYFKFDLQALRRATDERADASAVSKGLPRPYASSGTFRERTLLELDLECKKRARDLQKLVKNSQELVDWLSPYLEEKRGVRDHNLKFLRTIARFENVRLSHILECPALQAALSAFNRDLAYLTHTVWMEFREDALACVASCLSARKVEKTKQKGKIPCPHCARSFTVDGLSVHVVAKHPDIDPDTLAVKPASMDGKLHCRDCPRSTRVYMEQALADHRRDNSNGGVGGKPKTEDACYSQPPPSPMVFIVFSYRGPSSPLFTSKFQQRCLQPPQHLLHLEALPPDDPPREWLETLVKVVEASRPVERCAQHTVDLQSPRPVLATDLVGGNVIAVEVKPKWGFLPSPTYLSPATREIKLSTCRFCMHSHLRGLETAYCNCATSASWLSSIFVGGSCTKSGAYDQERKDLSTILSVRGVPHPDGISGRLPGSPQMVVALRTDAQSILPNAVPQMHWLETRILLDYCRWVGHGKPRIYARRCNVLDCTLNY
uniref:Inositol-pentakisphosphate 2-kinase n=1 Tax=Mycena chlorophos TaxID=658473 RepID=A0ABQ0L4D1_MYCCL|nr:predicted protein [Mycena chlorophos]